MMGQLPTKKQKQLLDFVRQYIQRHGYSPTYEEMTDALGVSSVATIHDHLQLLSKKKLIKIYHGAVRGVEVLSGSVPAQPIPATIEVPLLGYIAAGRPIEAIANETTTVAISPTLVSGNRRAYVLQVRGESMIEDGIFDGDYVVIQEQAFAENGDIVVALLEGGLATLKRFFKERDRIRLEPANAKMQPIYARQVQIQGKVTGLIRRF